LCQKSAPFLYIQRRQESSSHQVLGKSLIAFLLGLGLLLMSGAELLVDDLSHVVVKLSIDFGLLLFTELRIGINLTKVDGFAFRCVRFLFTITILFQSPVTR
jgi:hypothetical protein